MILSVKIVQKLQGRVDAPASKSYSIRASFIAACGGRSSIKGLSDCDDALVAERVGRALARTGGSKTFLVGESGTSLRFLLPLLPLHSRGARVKGKGTLIGRPNHHLCASLRRQGMDIQGAGAAESVPIEYKGGALKPGPITIDGTLSSQFISALLIALPRLAAESRITITGRSVVSSDYIVMTRQILAKAGVVVKALGKRTLVVPGNQHFQGLKNFHVPSDYGLAAFPMAAAALIDSKITLNGHFDDRFIQSDGHILAFLRRMGVRFQKTGKAIAMQGPFALKGGTFSLKDCPDLVPIMSVLGMFAAGRTRLVDIGHARVKESDRISDVRRELMKAGAKITETRDSLTIQPQPAYRRGITFDPHKDHRLAMAFTVLGLKIGGRVLDIECTAKSYPAFVKHMKMLGM